MAYGKVTVKQDKRGDWRVTVGAGDGMTLERVYYRREAAYSDARHIRGMFKRGEHPGAVCYRLGGYVIQGQEAAQ